MCRAANLRPRIVTQSVLVTLAHAAPGRSPPPWLWAPLSPLQDSREAAAYSKAKVEDTMGNVEGSAKVGAQSCSTGQVVCWLVLLPGASWATLRVAHYQGGHMLVGLGTSRFLCSCHASWGQAGLSPRQCPSHAY